MSISPSPSPSSSSFSSLSTNINAGTGGTSSIVGQTADSYRQQLMAQQELTELNDQFQMISSALSSIMKAVENAWQAAKLQ